MDRGAWWVQGCKDLDTTECAHAHEINHSFIHMNSCELVTEKTSKLRKAVPFLWSRLVVPKV